MTDYGKPSISVFIVWKTDLKRAHKSIVEMFTDRTVAEAFAFRQWASEPKPTMCIFDVQEQTALSH